VSATSSDETDALSSRGRSDRPTAARYRYPGAAPFADDDLAQVLFRGRDREIDEVVHSILSFDLFLVYAISGLGKSSLMNAGVFRELRARDYFPVPVRLNDPTSTPLALVWAQIQEAVEAREDITLLRHPAARGLPDPTTLWDLLAVTELWHHNALLRMVLVFDQFEELFTLGWDRDVRQTFIDQLGEVVRRRRDAADAPLDDARLPPPNAKIVLVMREDLIGELEALATRIPQIMAHRFRLEGLLPDDAERAISAPAGADDPRLETPRFTYSADAVLTILSFLGVHPDGHAAASGSVDPSQLQIVCQHVERSIVPGKQAQPVPGQLVEISASDLGGRDGLERILTDFYGRELARLPGTQRPLVRALCERGLINQRGRRLSLERGEIIERFGVSASLLDELVGRRLLRAEPRVGSVYYELAHDTLAAPIEAYRRHADAAARTARAARRRWLLGIAAAAVAITALVLAVRQGGNGPSTDQVAAIAVGDTTPISLAADSPTKQFQFDVTADAEAIVVTAAPEAGSDVDVFLQVTGDRVWDQADRWPSGEPERVIVNGDASAGTLTAVVTGDARDSISLSVLPITPTPLRPDGQTDSVVRDTLDERGFTAFELPGLAAGNLALVDARAASGSELAIGLDGSAESVNVGTEFGARDRAVLVVPGAASPRYVMVRALAATTGRYSVAAQSLLLTEVSIGGERVRGAIDADQPVSVVEFTADADETVRVDVTSDADLDAVVQVADPRIGLVGYGDDEYAGERESVSIDATRSVRYRVIVSGYAWSTGSFGVEVSRESTTEPLGSQPASSSHGANPDKTSSTASIRGSSGPLKSRMSDR
jgi:Novel STAND NTPase 1